VLAEARSLFFNFSMKTILILVLLACVFSGGACSRSDKQPDTAPQTTANSNLKSDAERLHRATAKAAEERKRAQAQVSPTPGVPRP
jgi:Na+-transporting methylmalonyl-CoA/oxaloacetate decarboxylase gamma subunit